MLQIRNVPDDIHRQLKVRAAAAGTTLSDMLLREVTEIANRPTTQDLLDRIRQRKAPRRPIDSVAAVRAERDGRR
jgi:plasmid stability protein